MERHPRHFAITLAFAHILAASAQHPLTIEWQHCLGGSDDDKVQDIKQTTDGGYVLVGYTPSTDFDVSGQHGANDLYLARYDRQGELQWTKALGGTAGELGYAVRQASDGGFVVAGATASTDGDVSINHGLMDAWVVKLSGEGTLEWERTFGGSDQDHAFGLAATLDGGWVIACQTLSSDGDVTVQHGGPDLWFVKLGATGSLEWQRSFGGTGWDSAASICVLPDGGYALAGATASNDGDVTGSHGGEDLWVLRLDADGGLLWQRTFGGSDDDRGASIVSDGEGGFVIGGFSFSNDGDVQENQGFQDIWLLNINGDGDLQWETTLGGSSSDLTQELIATQDGGYAVVGISSSDDNEFAGSYGPPDVILVRFGPDGQFRSLTRVGGTDTEASYGVVEALDGGFAIAAETRSNDIDVTDNHGGPDDIWFVKLTSEFSSIRGTLWVDMDGDGLFDPEEPVPGQRMVRTLDDQRFTLSRPDGTYELTVLDTGSYEFEPDGLEYFESVPQTRTAHFSVTGQVDTLNDFAFQAMAPVHDLACFLVSVPPFRPGMSAYYSITVSNHGNVVEQPSVVLLLDELMSFASSSHMPSLVQADSVVWSLPDLAPFASVQWTVQVEVSLDATIGQSLLTELIVRPVVGDIDGSNNTSQRPNTVQSSYDPNDIQVDRATLTTDELPLEPYLEYLVRFQNTGTDTAFSILLKNPLPIELQHGSLQLLETSHPVMASYNSDERILWFQFDDILLPDSNTNQVGSHGYVRYRIKPQSTLSPGDTIAAQVAIFFDYNAPVLTNTAQTVVTTPQQVDDPAATDERSYLFPNPSSGMVTIQSDLLKDGWLIIHDAMGRCVLDWSTSGEVFSISAGELKPGHYYVALRSRQGTCVWKLIVR